MKLRNRSNWATSDASTYDPETNNNDAFAVYAISEFPTASPTSFKSSNDESNMNDVINENIVAVIIMLVVMCLLVGCGIAYRMRRNCLKELVFTDHRAKFGSSVAGKISLLPRDSSSRSSSSDT